MGRASKVAAPTLRRCGLAAVLPHAHLEPYDWQHIRLPFLGHQTVPRAELTAVLVVVKAMVAAVELWTDRKLIAVAFEKGLRCFLPGCKLRSMARAWRGTAETKKAPLVVRWVPSHAEKFEDLCPTIDPLIYRGNAKADKLAKQAAREHPLSDKTNAEVREAEDQCKAILHRLVGIVSVFLAATPRQPKEVKPREIRPSMLEIIADARAASDHHLCIGPGGNSAMCTACLARAPLQQSKLQQWLSGSGSIDASGVPHPSHRMATRGLLAICLKCGCWSQSRHRALLRPCRHEPKTALQQMSPRRFYEHRPMPGTDLCNVRAAGVRKPDFLVVTGLDSDSAVGKFLQIPAAAAAPCLL